MDNVGQKFYQLDLREPYEYADSQRRMPMPVLGVILLLLGAFWTLMSGFGMREAVSGVNQDQKGLLIFVVVLLSLFVLLGLFIICLGLYNTAGYFVKISKDKKFKLNGLVTTGKIVSSAVEEKRSRSSRGGSTGYTYYIIKAEYTFTDNKGVSRTGYAQRRTLVKPPEYQKEQGIAVLFDNRRAVLLLKYTADGKTRNDPSLYNENFRLDSAEAQEMASDAAKELGQYLSGRTFNIDPEKPLIPRAYAGTIKIIGSVVMALGAGILLLVLFLTGIMNIFSSDAVPTDKIVSNLFPLIMGCIAGGAFLFGGAKIILVSSRKIYESKRIARKAYFTDALIYDKKDGPSVSGFMYFFKDWRGKICFGFEKISVFFNAPLFTFTENYMDNAEIILGGETPQEEEHEKYKYYHAICAYNDDGKSALIHKCALSKK